MAENKNKLFREKNLEQIESPESLNDYLQVTSPGIWIILATIVVADGEGTVCLVPEKALESAVKDRTVKIDKVEYELAPETLEPMIISEDTNIYWILAGNLKIGDIVYQVPVSEKLDEGVYSGTIVTERLSPMSLLLN